MPYIITYTCSIVNRKYPPLPNFGEKGDSQSKKEEWMFQHILDQEKGVFLTLCPEQSYKIQLNIVVIGTSV